MAKIETIENKLLYFLSTEVFSPDTLLRRDTDLIGAGLDSIALARILLFVEQTFGFWIPESEITLETLKNVQNFSAMIDRLQNES